jgi:hypothetical protein
MCWRTSPSSGAWPTTTCSQKAKGNPINHLGVFRFWRPLAASAGCQSSPCSRFLTRVRLPIARAQRRCLSTGAAATSSSTRGKVCTGCRNALAWPEKWPALWRACRSR